MTTIEIILSVAEASDAIDALDCLLGATDPDHQELLRQRYSVGSTERARVLRLLERLICARDLRTRLES